MPLTKEEVYEQEISPLLMQLAKLCKSSGISMVLGMNISGPGNEDLAAAVAIADGDGEFPGYLAIMKRVVDNSVGEVVDDRTDEMQMRN